MIRVPRAGGVLTRGLPIQRGFSLIELSIVIIIGAILGGAALAVFNAQVSSSRVMNARTSLDVARQSLIGYIAAPTGGSYRLPFADDAVTGAPCTAGGANIDNGQSDNNCLTGNIPWSTLGISAATITDHWGGYMSYTVDNTLAVSGLRQSTPAAANTAFTLRTTVTDPTLGNSDDVTISMSVAQLRGVLISGGVVLPP